MQDRLRELDSELGPVDFVTTHFVASVDNLPCTAELCGDLCEIGNGTTTSAFARVISTNR